MLGVERLQMARVLIIHGWTNKRPVGHWQRRLAAALRAQGHVVSYPQLPNPDDPQLDDWLEVVEAELAQLAEVEGREGEELVVVAHSLGCVTWMHVALRETQPELVSRLLLVAPPERSPISPLPSFLVQQDDATLAEALFKSTRSVVLVGSDSDPWQPSGIQTGVGDPLGLQAVVVHGAKHFSTLDGFSQWHGVIDWVNDPSADLTKI